MPDVDTLVIDAIIMAPPPLENHSEEAERNWHAAYWRWYYFFRGRALDGKEVYCSSER